MLLFDKALEKYEKTKDIKSIYEITENKSPLDLLEENDPQPDDSLGALINKLNHVTMQMWHNQETMYEIRRMYTNQFVEKYKDQLDVLHIIIKRSCDLNVQRSRIVDAIDVKAYQMGQKTNKEV